ncbi:hypothetical protein, partial [Streptomyces milbemycinicus]
MTNQPAGLHVTASQVKAVGASMASSRPPRLNVAWYWARRPAGASRLTSPQPPPALSNSAKVNAAQARTRRHDARTAGAEWAKKAAQPPAPITTAALRQARTAPRTVSV